MLGTGSPVSTAITVYSNCATSHCCDCHSHTGMTFSEYNKLRRAPSLVLSSATHLPDECTALSNTVTFGKVTAFSGSRIKMLPNE